MSLKAVASRMRGRAPAQGQQPPQNTEELERAKRAQAQAAKEAEAARRETAQAQAAAAAAAAERDGVRIDSLITSAASKARALNPAQVSQLLRGRVKLVDGKATVEGSDKDVDAFVAEWLGTEGKHFLPASVPGGGSGGPANPQPPPQKATHDLSTNEGLTAYARSRAASATRTIGNQPVQMPRTQSGTQGGSQ